MNRDQLDDQDDTFSDFFMNQFELPFGVSDDRAASDLSSSISEVSPGDFSLAPETAEELESILHLTPILPEKVSENFLSSNFGNISTHFSYLSIMEKIMF
jgi:hypothetical protein